MEAHGDVESRRDRARSRLKKKREFARHLVVYLVVNVLLIILCATADDREFFWPMFPLLGWGIGVVFHGWDTCRGEPTEQQIRREMERMG